jgi:phosphoglycolate phosphatase-like HAD superfamily hydrolase
MRRLLEQQGVDTSGLCEQVDDWSTPVYIKPIRDGHEQNRIDFGSSNQLTTDTCSRVLTFLRAALPGLDVVVVNQQLVHGLHTPEFQEGLRDLMHRDPGPLFLSDCRHIPSAYPGSTRKLNDVEAARLRGQDVEYGDVIPRAVTLAAARDLAADGSLPVIVTRGRNGCVTAAGDRVHEVPGLHVIGRTDPVGAGDSLLAGVAAALGAGAPLEEAAEFGNFVAGVTVQKLFQTGVATPEEVREIGRSPDYVYAPELADNPRHARLIPGTRLEAVTELPQGLRITHAIFDHDGTISVLRQGWEDVMHPMMVQAILGERFLDADETLFARVDQRVRDYIDQTTGVQTLVQMQGLVDLVREFGVVAAERILDAHGYKAVYNEALLTTVRERLEQLAQGELDASDLTVKGAVPALEFLFGRGVKLYLASGTDQEDVVREARALGYARLFEGRIYGAVGDARVEAKRVVLDRILEDVGSRNVQRLVTFGDGPVEMRETRKRGATAVGIADDEVRRYGLSLAKRRRLIRAGAQLVAADWTQFERLFALLGVEP